MVRGLGGVVLHYVGRGPVGANQDIRFRDVINTVHYVCRFQIEELRSYEIANLPARAEAVVVRQDVHYAGVAELRKVPNGTEDVSVAARTFEWLGNDPINPKSLFGAGTGSQWRWYREARLGMESNSLPIDLSEPSANVLRKPFSVNVRPGVNAKAIAERGIID